MEDFVDHYIVLGLPSGEEALKLSEKEITKAYRLKAKHLHPDKRPDDPDAHEKFQRLNTSYEVLKDEKTRKLFDDHLLKSQRKKQYKKPQVDSKRCKMMSDLEERERSNHAARPYDEEERIARKQKEEVDRIRAKHAKESSAFIVTVTKDGVVAARRTLCGDLSNPLLARPLQRAPHTAKKSAEAEPQSNRGGAGFQADEDWVMQRVRKEAMKQK